MKYPKHLSIATQTHTTQPSQGALHPSTSVLLLSPPKSPTLFTICLNLRPSRLICVHLHNHAQQRLLRNRQLIFCLHALDRIPSLASIPLGYLFFSAHVVVGWLGKSTERPVQYAETAGLDGREVDVPFCFDFVGEGFGKAFDGPCGGAVDFEHRHSERV